MEGKATFVPLRVEEMKIYHGYDEIKTLKGNISLKETEYSFAVRTKEGKVTIYSKPEFGYQITMIDESNVDRWDRAI